MFVHFGGYEDYPLGENKYQVVYASGHAAFRSETKVFEFALIRASELTLDKGFSHFIILDEYKDEYHAVLEVQLTNETADKMLDAETTLIKYKTKYGFRKVEPIK